MASIILFHRYTRTPNGRFAASGTGVVTTADFSISGKKIPDFPI
jgi:hypothetical protein